jgi:hypothetical protein
MLRHMPVRLAAITPIRPVTEANEDTGRRELPRAQSTGSLARYFQNEAPGEDKETEAS